MASARSGRSRELTPEQARTRLIAAGLDPSELDGLIEIYTGVEKGDFIYPVTADQAFTKSKHGVSAIALRLERSADEFEGVWTVKGKRMLRENQRDFNAVISMPNLVRMCAAILRDLLNDGGDKLPSAKKQIKMELIRRTKEITGSWHDADLAALFGDSTDSWKAWRKKWCKPLPTPR